VDSPQRTYLAIALNVALLWAVLSILAIHPPTINLRGAVLVAGHLTGTVLVASFFAGMLLTEWDKASAMGHMMVSFFLFFLSYTMYTRFINQPVREPIAIVLVLTIAPLLLGVVYMYPSYWAGRAGQILIRLFASKSTYRKQQTSYEDSSPHSYVDQDSSEAPDPYALLGLSADASPKEVKQRYRELAKIYHPDKSRNPRSAELFMLIQEAYLTINRRIES